MSQRRECPFCGFDDSLEMSGSPSQGTLHIFCRNCGARGPEHPFAWGARDSWDSRAETDRYTITEAGRAMLRDAQQGVE